MKERWGIIQKNRKTALKKQIECNRKPEIKERKNMYDKVCYENKMQEKMM